MADALPIDMLDIVAKDGGLLSGITGRTTLGRTESLLPGGAKGIVPRRRTVVPDRDAKLPGRDTVAPGRDAKLPGHDAAAPGHDAAAPGRDTVTPRRDAAAPDRQDAVPRHQSARPQITTSGSRWLTGGAVTRTTGRVFLTVSGVDFVCSASTVKSANRDLVVTAGHCVKDGAGEWAANWQFVPGYRVGGGHPYGQYAARRMFVAGPWARSANDNFDVGMVALTTWAGKHVTDVVGAQQIAFNATRGGQAFGFGFPADPPYDGEHLVYCAGRLREDPYKQTRDQGLSCDMTAGSSGGPWLSGFDPATGTGRITSLSSFKYSDDQRTMYGPYFGESARTLFNTAERA
nr:hypothetical protein [Nonomuraea rhizosphaerae]